MSMSARRDIIRHGKNWKLWVLCDRDPTERWVDGRVALLGDAAHPMLQYFAQGACQAMEDAVCLSHMLGSHPGDHASALEKYRAQRFPRTARVQLLSRAIGEHIYHPAGEHARLRNAIMSAKIVGGLVPRSRLALWRDGVGGVRTSSRRGGGRRAIHRQRVRVGPKPYGYRQAATTTGAMRRPSRCGRGGAASRTRAKSASPPGGRSCRCRSSAVRR